MKVERVTRRVDSPPVNDLVWAERCGTRQNVYIVGTKYSKQNLQACSGLCM
jgi:hypothetical protein